MKLAVIFIAYQAEELNAVLAPWLQLRFGIPELGIAPSSKIDLKIAATTALFKERWDVGEKYDNDSTEAKLCAYRDSGAIDSLSIIKHPILDYESRAVAWETVKGWEPDLVFQLDADEFYRVDEINAALSWIEENGWYDFYRINFKNYFGLLGPSGEKPKTYVLDFKPVRVINNNKRDRIKTFYWDNDAEFQDGTKTPYCAGALIPPKYCNPVHYSWIGDRETLERKIRYQHRCLGCCSYIITNGQLGFDMNYYAKFNIPSPTIVHEC